MGYAKCEVVGKWPVGSRVRALKDLDPVGANVPTGATGTIYEAAGFHWPGEDIMFGPIVKWDRGGYCNVYDGHVELLDKT